VPPEDVVPVRGRRTWGWVVGVAAAMAVVAAVAMLLLSRMPFGGAKEPRAVTRAAPQTVEEGDGGTATTAQVAEPAGTQAGIRRARPAVTAARRPAPPPPVAAPAPQVVTQPASAAGELTESQAVDRLSGYLRSAATYPLPGNCIRVRSQGYRNVGYTLDVVDTCGASTAALGRWRVDARTGEIFRQRADGRFLRP
jgi:hypothetical protein